jgi:hypothetical protein
VHHHPPSHNPSVDYFDPLTPIFSAAESGWLDIVGGPARLLGDAGWHLATACPIHVRMQFTQTGRIQVLDEGSPDITGPLVIDLERPTPRGTVEGELARTVETGLRSFPGFPFAHGLNIAVAHSVPLFSGLLWREPLMEALHRTLAQATRSSRGLPATLDSPSPASHGKARWFAVDTGYPAPPDSIHGERIAVAALMAYRMIAEQAGLNVREVRRGLVNITDPVWHGSPLNIPPSVWEGMFRHRVPESMTGEVFLDLYSGINDPRHRVEKSVTYSLRAALHYIAHEAARARLFRALPAAAWETADQLSALGELLYQSHAQADLLGLSVEPANIMVSLAMDLGPTRGIHGARLTGNGGGGTVVVLASESGTGSLDELCRAYEHEAGLTPSVVRL